MEGFTAQLNEWGRNLQAMLDGSLESGSATALLIVFAAGVVTSFTPCVYPMIPVTVTYMGTAAAGSRVRAVSLSAVYVLGMALVYSGLGVVTAMLGKTFGKLTYTWWIYGAFGCLMLLLAAAMLGWINIPVPGFAGKVQTAGSRKGGLVGALLMGVASGFIAAPCSAPVLGSLLIYVARTRDVLWGGTLLFFFSIGLGTLLMILGIFSGLLANLPRAGAWMNRIKFGFGIAMVLVAVWFFYQAVQIGLTT